MAWIVWTARIGMTCYALRLLVEVAARDAAARRVWARGLWTIGWLVMGVHFALAFHIQHGWSHAHAVADTARRTAEVVGWYWGGGVWINYAFLAAWTLDVARMWGLARFSPAAERRWNITLHAFMAFMAFNATAVFGPAWWIGVVSVYVLLWGGLWRRSLRATHAGRRSDFSPPESPVQ